MKYTEMLLEINVPRAEKLPYVSEIEKAVRDGLKGKYHVLKVKVERYELVTVPDVSGVYYTGKIGLRVRVEGDIPVKKGDRIVFPDDSVRGLVVELIILTLSAIALLVAASKVGAVVLEVYKGFLEETEKKLHIVVILGGIVLGGLYLWKLKNS